MNKETIFNHLPTPFRIDNCHGKIKNVNPRKEIHGEDDVLTVDLKIEVDCPIAISDALLGAENGHASKFLEGLYDDRGELRYWSIGTISYSCDFEDCEVKLSSKLIKGCRLSKFSIHPKDRGQCLLTFSVSHHPEKGDIQKLVDLMMIDIKISAHPPAGLFD